MLPGIEIARLKKMTEQERRWLQNVKKAFYESDRAYTQGNAEDRCFEELCKAIDTAKTLRRSLRGDDISLADNKSRFIEFLDCDIPNAEQGGLVMRLLDRRTGKRIDYSFAGLVYAIRCMVHENENLNAAEQPDYHIQLDWRMSRESYFIAITKDGCVQLNAHVFWRRVREVLARFITGIDSEIALSEGRPFSFRIDPPFLSIRPDLTPGLQHD